MKTVHVIHVSVPTVSVITALAIVKTVHVIHVSVPTVSVITALAIKWDTQRSIGVDANEGRSTEEIKNVRRLERSKG